MAVNCSTCTRKNDAVSENHCTEFHHIPEIDACAMHTEGAAVQAANNKPTGEFLWLRETHQSSEVTKQPTIQ